MSGLPPPSYDELRAENAVLRAMVADLTARLERATARIADLEARLKTSSTNSSKPPSSDKLAKPAPKSLRSRSGRRPARHAVRRDLFAYLAYYIQDRIHSANNYRTPVETRLGYRHNRALAA